MSSPSFVLEGTAVNFDRLVLENSHRGPVLVDFWAPWAGPSLRQGELLKRLANDYRGRFLLVTLNTDQQKAVAERYGVKGLPSCKLFRRGEVVEHLHGMQTEADYRALIDRHVLPLADKVQAAALKVWQAGQQDKAVQVLAEGAMAEPENAAIPLLLAKLLVSAGRYADAQAVLEALPPAVAADRAIRRLRAHLRLIRAAEVADVEEQLQAALDADPDDHDSRFSLAARRLLADDYDGALAVLAELHGRAPGWEAGVAMQGIAAIAEVLGPDDPRVHRFRRLLFAH
jgi:putative thioredoxin